MDALHNLKKDESRVVTKADKGNKVVILDKDEYIRKMNELLEDDRVYEKLRSDPLKDDQRNFNRSLKEILDTNFDYIQKFTARLPSLPYLYGLPKLHKEGVPFRPIISNVGSISS